MNRYQTVTDTSVLRFQERLEEADAAMEVIGYSVAETRNGHTVYSALLRRRNDGTGT